MDNSITADQVNALVMAWYRALDNHDPVEACNALLAEKDLVMKFPDGDIKDFASFKKWYDRVTNIFFDENHYVQAVEPKISGDSADLRVCVGWQASVWEPPSAKSKRVALDATQRWKVRRSNRNPYGVEIVFYDATAEPFKYAPGFAHL